MEGDEAPGQLLQEVQHRRGRHGDVPLLQLSEKILQGVGPGNKEGKTNMVAHQSHASGLGKSIVLKGS